MKKTHNVLIDNEKEILTLVYTTPVSLQYNTKNDKSAHTFRHGLDSFPKNTPIKTNGHTYIILD